MQCPNCGVGNTLVKIPKHRNGFHGRYCGFCKKIFYRDVKCWDHDPAKPQEYGIGWLEQAPGKCIHSNSKRYAVKGDTSQMKQIDFLS